MTSSLSRRRFFQLAGLATLAFPLRGWAAIDTSGGDEIVILNDIHLTGIPEEKIPANAKDDDDHLRTAVKQILALAKKPAAVIINGDLALAIGTAADYAVVRELIAPLREAGIPVHLTLGNHDVRDIFTQAFPEMKSASDLKEPRHNGLIDLPSTRLILLDTLDQSPGPSGKLGAEQIAWILAKIDEVPTKQVILVGHHNPQVGGDTSHYKGGLADTADFWPEVAKRPQVKAYIHGHTHEWTQALENGIHIISTIACAYVFNKNTNATGWTSARFNAHGFQLKLNTLETDHAWNGEAKWFFGRQPAPKKTAAPKKK
jgi:3',5'-cyclic AMP phosphodiesterase CpdA